MAVHQKGDIYTLTSGNKMYPADQPSGPDDLARVVFVAVARHVAFEVWEAAQHVSYFLDPTPTPLGYHFIIAETIQAGSMSNPEVVGIFVPAHLDKALVADDVRRQFGVRTALFTAACERARRLSNTIGHGNDITPSSAAWLYEHVRTCEHCMTLPVE